MAITRSNVHSQAQKYCRRCIHRGLLRSLHLVYKFVGSADPNLSEMYFRKIRPELRFCIRSIMFPQLISCLPNLRNQCLPYCPFSSPSSFLFIYFGIYFRYTAYSFPLRHHQHLRRVFVLFQQTLDTTAHSHLTLCFSCQSIVALVHCLGKALGLWQLIDRCRKVFTAAAW